MPSPPRVFVSTVPFATLDRRPLERLAAAGAEVTINPLGRRLKAEELAAFVADADVLIAGTEPVTAAAIHGSRRLKLIARVGIGLDNVDLAAARAAGVTVAYTPDGPAPAVAELTVGLLLTLLREVPRTDRGLRRGEWFRHMGRRLACSTLGVIGVGRIGRRVIAHVTGGFPGVRVLANDRTPDPAFGDRHGVTWVERDTLFRESDAVTVHVPLTAETRGLVGARELSSMKPSAVLVNTARGGIVDEAALAEALEAGTIASAAVDVFEEEPYGGRLATLERTLVTCHIGSMSADCRVAMEIEATEDAVRFLAGEPLRGLVPAEEYPPA